MFPSAASSLPTDAPPASSDAASAAAASSSKRKHASSLDDGSTHMDRLINKKQKKKKSREQRAEEKGRALAGQQALDKGEMPLAIDPKEEARYNLLAEGSKVTREDLGYSLKDALERASDELAKYDCAPIDACSADEDDRDLKMSDFAPDAQHLKDGILSLMQSKDNSKSQMQRKRPGRRQDTRSKKTSLVKTVLEGDDEDEAGSRPRDVSGDFEIYEDDDKDNNKKPIESKDLLTPKRRMIYNYDAATFGTLADQKPESLNIQATLQRFDDYIRLVIRQMKLTAAKFICNIINHQFAPMTRRFLVIAHNSDEDWLVKQVLDGIPDSTKHVLGKEGFTTSDLLSLPRWTDSDLCQKGVYLDVVCDPQHQTSRPSLYVGSAVGQDGISQRWCDYVSIGKGRVERGLHAEAISGKMESINLRGLAQYGSDPIAWLPLFSESVFMVLLGTVRDTGKRWTGKNSNMCCDELYDCIAECRKGLPDAIGDGLNSTWSLIQGYRTRYGGQRVRCCNVECNRPMVPKKDPLYEKHRFTSSDMTRPGESIICINCLVHTKRHQGRARPREFEERRRFRAENPRTMCMADGCMKPLQYYHYKSPQPPGFNKGCIVNHPSLTNGKHMWYCDRHYEQFRNLRRQLERGEAIATAPSLSLSSECHEDATSSNGTSSRTLGPSELPVVKAIPRSRLVDQSQSNSLALQDGNPPAASKTAPRYPWWGPGKHRLPYTGPRGPMVPRYPWWGPGLFRDVGGYGNNNRGHEKTNSSLSWQRPILARENNRG